MNTITDRELKSLRKAQEQFMPNEVVIERRQWVGDQEFVPGAVGTTKCRITAGWGRWAVVADRYQGITPYTVTVPWDADIQPADSLIDAYGRAFQIRDMRSPTDYMTAKQLLAELVTDG